jgi:acetyl-CoA synthetase
MVLARGRRRRCPIVDTWWQTETGGILISPSPAHSDEARIATKPLPGIKPLLVDAEARTFTARRAATSASPLLAGQMRTVWGDHRRFFETISRPIAGAISPATAAARRGRLLLITGAVDDVINVSGHRIGTAEVESRIGRAFSRRRGRGRCVPARIKGQAIHAYVTLNAWRRRHPTSFG